MPQHESHPIFRPRLFKQTGEMKLHGPDGDTHLDRDLRITETLGQQCQYLRLAEYRSEVFGLGKLRLDFKLQFLPPAAPGRSRAHRPDPLSPAANLLS